MSKNLTRKGLAFGALVALATSVIAGAPASADNGQITLLPNGGTGTNASYNSIIGAGLTLSGTLNPALIESAAVAATDADIAKAVYVVSNPNASKIKLSLAASASNGTAAAINDGYLVYNAAGNTSADGTAGSTTYAFADLGTVDTSAVYVDYTAGVLGTSAASYVTNATKIVVRASVEGGASVADSIAPITVDAVGTSSTSISVQLLTDTDAAAAGTTGKVGSFENNSPVRDVTLYPVGAVSATTTITTLAQGSSDFAAKVVYGSAINPSAVAGATGVVLTKDGTAAYVSASSAGVNAARLTPVAANVLTVTGYGSDADGSTLTNFAAGIYSAQTYFTTDGGTTWVAVGSSSAVADLTSGGNATVDGVKVSAVDTKDQVFTDGDATVRAGTKTALLTVQAQDTTTDTSASVEAANIQVKAVVTATKLNTGSTATVSGATGTLAATDDVVTAYGRTNSSGAVDFTFTNTVGKATDKLTAVISVKNNAGQWVDATTEAITWSTAAYASRRPSQVYLCRVLTQLLLL